MLRVRMLVQLVLGVEDGRAEGAGVGEAVREVNGLQVVQHVRSLTEAAPAQGALVQLGRAPPLLAGHGQVPLQHAGVLKYYT